jgi:acetyl esterase
MKKLYDIHKDFRSALFFTTPTNWLAIHWINFIYKLGWHFYNSHKEVKVTAYKIESADGKKIKVHVYEPPVTILHNPCMIYYHGGGFMLSISPRTRRRMERYAIEAGCIVVLVDYRLMPRYRYPKAVEDAYSALMWVEKHADELKIDMKKLALAGDSAGGYLASLVSHMSIEHNGPKICLQVLLYPVVDHRMTSESMDVFTDTPVWNAKKNKEMWKKYLRTMKEEEALLSPMDYPVRNQLPKTYIEVAQYDCLHDEGVVYGQKLQSAGIDVEIKDIKGGIHGYDNFEFSQVVQELMKDRIQLLRKTFNHS